MPSHFPVLNTEEEKNLSMYAHTYNHTHGGTVHGAYKQCQHVLNFVCV